MKILAAVVLASVSMALEPNYDESKVPEYTLPDQLVTKAGKQVTSRGMWYQARRPEIARMFEQHVYGQWLPEPEEMRFETVDDTSDALGGEATRRQVIIHFGDDESAPSIELLLYLPNDVDNPVPVFLYMNFYGNHTIYPDPDIRLSKRWMRERGEGVEDHRATDASRGSRAANVPVDTILDRGYGIATFYYGDAALDHPDKFRGDVLSLFQDTSEPREGDDTGAIGAWAWASSRALDYLATDADLDEERVAVLGHSRLGKTALWAGAMDERFAITISNNSGCGGAALSRRRYGETVARINNVFPHWFCTNFREYNGREHALPVDQHMLISLIAPRPAYVASATEDRWADPKGEFLAAYHAGPVYELLGEEPLPVKAMPEPGEPVHATIGYHLRMGDHGIYASDWEHYLDFADKHLKSETKQ